MLQQQFTAILEISFLFLSPPCFSYKQQLHTIIGLTSWVIVCWMPHAIQRDGKICIYSEIQQIYRNSHPDMWIYICINNFASRVLSWFWWCWRHFCKIRTGCDLRTPMHMNILNKIVMIVAFNVFISAHL